MNRLVEAGCLLGRGASDPWSAGDGRDVRGYPMPGEETGAERDGGAAPSG